MPNQKSDSSTKKKRDFSHANEAFPTILRDLMNEKGCNQQELAEYLGITRQTVSYYCTGTSSPDWKKLNRMADYFGVSVGYITGHEKTRSTDPNVRTISEYTGLSVDTIEGLHLSRCSPINTDGLDENTAGMLEYTLSQCIEIEEDLLRAREWYYTLSMHGSAKAKSSAKAGLTVKKQKKEDK